MALLGLLCASAFAEPPPLTAPVTVDSAAAQQAFQGSRSAPLLILNENATNSEPSLLDEEFGVQQLVLRPAREHDHYFRADAGGFFTTNVAQIHEPEISDWVGVSLLAGGWLPELSEGLRFHLSGEQRFWRFADNEELDFDELGGRAGLWWQPFPDRTSLGIPLFSAWAHYRYQGLFQPLTWDDVYYETHFLEAGARRAFALGPLTTALIELNGAHSVDGGPDFLRRDEYSLSLACLHALSDRTALGLAVVNSWRPHHSVDWEDWNHYASLMLRRALTRRLVAQAGVSAIRNQSNVDFFDYKALNAELGLKLSLSW